MTSREIDVSVITPSLNMLSYLERCVASVADQEGVRVEHLVMDGGSRDGTAERLAARPALISEVRPIMACMKRSTVAFAGHAGASWLALTATNDICREHLRRRCFISTRTWRSMCCTAMS
jgi:glycosyltransferase involved in cell wall biosynthesis